MVDMKILKRTSGKPVRLGNGQVSPEDTFLGEDFIAVARALKRRCWGGAYPHPLNSGEMERKRIRQLRGIGLIFQTSQGSSTACTG